MAGLSFSNSQIGLAHALGHAMGAYFGIPPKHKWGGVQLWLSIFFPSPFFPYYNLPILPQEYTIHTGEEVPKSEFSYKGKYGNWRKLMAGQIDPIQGGYYKTGRYGGSET